MDDQAAMTERHAAIYALIAGTYTPVCLLALPSAWGWSILGVVWGLAAVGILTDALSRQRTPDCETSGGRCPVPARTHRPSTLIDERVDQMQLCLRPQDVAEDDCGGPLVHADLDDAPCTPRERL